MSSSTVDSGAGATDPHAYYDALQAAVATNPANEKLSAWILYTKEMSDPQDARDLICRAFEKIKCRSTVLDYNVRFDILMKEVPSGFRHPEYLKYRYKEGLPGYIRNFLNNSRPDLELPSLMREAQACEHSICDDEFDANSPSLKILNNNNYYNRPTDPSYDYRKPNNTTPTTITTHPKQRSASYDSRAHFPTHRTPPQQNHDEAGTVASVVSGGSTASSGGVVQSSVVLLEPEDSPLPREPDLCYRCPDELHLVKNCPKTAGATQTTTTSTPSTGTPAPTHTSTAMPTASTPGAAKKTSKRTWSDTMAEVNPYLKALKDTAAAAASDATAVVSSPSPTPGHHAQSPPNNKGPENDLKRNKW